MSRLSSGDAPDRSTAPSADDITDPTLAAEVDEAAVANADQPSAGGDAPSTPPTEELKTAGTDEDVAVADAGAADGGAPPKGDPPPTDAGAETTSDGAAPDATAPEQPAAPPPADGDAVSTEPDPVPTAGTDTAPAAEPATTEPATPEPEPEPEPVDELRQPLIDRLRASLGDGVVDSHVRVGDDAWVRVRPDVWRRAAEVCRNELGLTYFCYLSMIDWLPAPAAPEAESAETDGDAAPAAAVKEMTQGYAGGDTRFQLLARLYSPARHLGINLKCDLAEDDFRVESWSAVFAGADWHERETWEMFGVEFVGHPHLVHIYLPGDFEGHPLRKDFPLLAREVKPWPGLVDVEPMPGEPEGEAEGDEGGGG
ncbi:MAG TPA: NADH-quinone oxidoreductase subunit C [Acidimicrobiales bacterium]|nr:NADH-quinone oxidoreductase subunit C [Acidimicrobiales bacterium]